MRLSSGVFMVRYIQKDTSFTSSDGKTYIMRAGDRVAMYPPAIHKDPEIFEDPLVGIFPISINPCPQNSEASNVCVGGI